MIQSCFPIQVAPNKLDQHGPPGPPGGRGQAPGAGAGGAPGAGRAAGAGRGGGARPAKKCEPLALFQYHIPSAKKITLNPDPPPFVFHRKINFQVGKLVYAKKQDKIFSG